MKINVKQVLSESAIFYRKNFKNMAGISFVLFLFNVFMYTMIYIKFGENLRWAFWLVSFVGLMLIIIWPKLVMAMAILINSLLDRNEVTKMQAYSQTKGKNWLWLGYAMLIWVIPLIAIAFMEIPFARLIGDISSAFVHALFYMLFPMLAIEPKTNRYLKKSIGMIEGNYISALILTLITVTFLSSINGILRGHIFQGEATELFISGMAYAIIFFFVFPFVETVNVVVYRQYGS